MCVKTGEINYDEPESGSWTEWNVRFLGCRASRTTTLNGAIALAQHCLIALPITVTSWKQGTIPSASDSARNRHKIHVFTLIKIGR